MRILQIKLILISCLLGFSLNAQTSTPIPIQDSSNQATQFSADVSSSGTNGKPLNAVIEGIQITADKGTKPEEKIVSGYFIFHDKPSSYFYKVKTREKKIIFEFNDATTGPKEIPSIAEPPIKGFSVISETVDINASKGNTPDLHNRIQVIFDFDRVPDIKVNDDYSIIIFSFKWTTNPSQVSHYALKKPAKKVFWWSSTGVGLVGGGAALVYYYYFLKPDDAQRPLDDLDVADLPGH